MSFTITITSNAREIADAIRRGDREVLQRVDRALGRGAAELAREMRTRAPKDTTQLTNAVQTSRAGPLEHHVVAAKDYASYQEQGTGPGGRPTLDQTLAWLRRKSITPRTPMSQRSLAFLIRRTIARRGVPKQPFAQPALEATRSRLDALVRASVTQGLRAMSARP